LALILVVSSSTSDSGLSILGLVSVSTSVIKSELKLSLPTCVLVFVCALSFS
jgi:hypothetical protein